MRKKISLLFLFISALLLATSIKAQIKLPPVTNFDVKDYDAGNQNWSIESAEGYIYVANNDGLLEFDGTNWRLYKLPNKTIVRSVKVFQNKIYTGSYEEFGYWERSDTGILQYTSLSKTLPISVLDSQSIWEIYELNGRILFKSFGSIFIYQNKVITTIKPDFLLMAGGIIHDKFIVQGIDNGMFELKGNELVLIENTEEIGNYRVQAITALSDNQIVIGTSLNGCFTYSENKLKPWNNTFNDALKKDQLNTLNYFNGAFYAGTIKNGLYKYNPDSNTFTCLNVKNGLQNNTVLSSVIDDISNTLWLALDNGISAIPIDFYAYYLNPFKEDIGAVYDMVKLQNEVYLATNTGIYKIDNKEISFIDGSQGHTWSLTKINDQVICGHNTGTYVITDGKFNLISKKNGGYFFKPIPNTANLFIQGNYSGLTVYTQNSESWISKDIKGLNFPIKNIVFEKPHIAWVSHSYKGVYRITFSENYEDILSIEEKYNSEFPNIYDIKLFEIERNIAFFSNENWYVYNALEDKIEAFKSLNKILGKDKNAIILNKFSDTPVVFKNDDNIIFMRTNLQDEHSQVYLPKKYYNSKLVHGESKQNTVVVTDSAVYIALYNDILVVNPNELKTDSIVIPASASRILVNKIAQPLYSEVYLKKSDTIQIALKTPYLSNNTIEYSLDNTHWIPTKGNITLTNLPYGTNELGIRSLSNFDQYSSVNTIILKTKTPWYLGVWGVLLLLLIALLILYLITTINKYVLIKHRRYLDEQFEHQQEISRKEIALENEKKFNELLKRQHVTELNSKTKELANTAMEMTKKDELLDHIKKELVYFKSEIIDKNKFQKLLKTIDKNIHTSKDWEVFQSNFNEIHDSFFKTLVKRHSDLTSKDLKLCAYLKMNLSTKEIAPIMRISIRGVEIHRYRLRKKLELNNEQNLNEYLINIP